MDASDPRHGEYAGAVAHWADGEPACPACLTVARRSRKARSLDAHRGNPRRAPLGDDCIAVIAGMSRRQLSDATGIRSDKFSTLLRLGPQKMVSRDTRAKILAAAPQPWTPIGIQRRLRGLSRLGWSMREIASRTGRNMDGLKRLRRRKDLRFVRADVAAAIIAVYDELCATIPPTGASSTKTTGDAIARGYESPFAWNDIDNDLAPSGVFTGTLAQRQGPSRASVDHARVERLLAGEWTLAPQATRAERAAVLARWPGTLNDLERLSSWRVDRYHLPNGAA